MLMNWKKSLLAAGVLATLVAGSAFAAVSEAEDAATQQKGLEYNAKVEQQAPASAKDRSPFTHHKDGKHYGHKHHHDGGFHGHHGGPGYHHKDGFHGHHGGPGHHHKDGFHGEKHNRPGKLTLEQRQMLAKEREQFFANWQTMNERERREATEKFINRVNEERMKNMTEDEKKAFEKKQEARKAEREKIAKMTDAERHEYFKKKHDEMVIRRTKNMSPEEKKRFLERDKRQQERMEAFWKKWQQMTPEEKEQWKKDHHRFGPGQDAPGPRGHRGHRGIHDGRGSANPEAAAAKA